MLKARVYLLSCSLLFVMHATVRPQDGNAVLAKGDPPLTQLMFGRFVAVLEWTLDVRLPVEEQLRIQQLLIRAWQANDQTEVKGALDILQTYEGLTRLNKEERNAARENLRAALLDGLRQAAGVRRLSRESVRQACRRQLSALRPEDAAPVACAHAQTDNGSARHQPTSACDR